MNTFFYVLYMLYWHSNMCYILCSKLLRAVPSLE